MQLSPAKRFPSQGRCVYCLRSAMECRLTDEHMMPRSFGGNFILQSGSCTDCAKETHAIEGHCSGRMFKALRVHHKIPTRRPKKRPKHLTVLDGKEPANAPPRDVPVSQAPGVVVFPWFEPPGMLAGMLPSNQIKITNWIWYTTTADSVARQKKLEASGFSGALAYLDFEPVKFARVLAKIAHCYAAASIGITKFRPLLPAIILGADPNVSHYVGSNAAVPSTFPLLPGPTAIHQVGTDTVPIGGASYIYAQIRLFSYFRPLTPVYTVVVGEYPIS
jgi:hypothetical protein